jgi:tetratricopeptide (TPR) repeat protein
LDRATVAFARVDNVDPYNAARSRMALGTALHHTGRTADATREIRQALADMRRLKSGRGQALAHQALGEVHLDTDQRREARVHLREALAYYERLGDREAAAVRTLLALIPPADPDLHREA